MSAKLLLSNILKKNIDTFQIVVVVFKKISFWGYKIEFQPWWYYFFGEVKQAALQNSLKFYTYICRKLPDVTYFQFLIFC